MKKIVLLFFTLVLFSTAVVVGFVRPAVAEGTIYIRADGNVEGTTHITSVDNVTYTFTDNINDEIVVERNNIMIDGARYTLQGTGSGYGIDLTGRSNVTVKNVEIKNFTRGIHLHKSSSNNISGNILVGNKDGIIYRSSNNNVVSGNDISENKYDGISFSRSSNNSIYGNNITNSEHYGIYLDYSSNNNISGNYVASNKHGISVILSSNNNKILENNVTNNQEGISLSYSSNNVLRYNNITNNEYNFRVSGSNISHFTNDIDETNMIDGKRIYYWVNRHNDYVPSVAGYVSLINCTNITVQNLSLTNNKQGALLAYTTNSTITKNDITNNDYGIWLYKSTNNTISENIIANNNISIALFNGSSNSRISENRIADNDYGICLNQSSYNIVSGNNITNNDYGILLVDSSNNIIYHNNFVDNAEQVISSNLTNVWDDGYPSGGNYWSDYNGTDMYWGPGQNLTGSDFIGDTPYVIDSNSTDRYPLLIPYETEPPTITILSPENKIYAVNVVLLTFTVDEATLWMGYSRDGKENLTITGNITLSDLSDGWHYVAVYANDTFGNMGSNTASFAVDTVPPNITVVSQLPEDNVLVEDIVKINAAVIDVVSGVEWVALNYTNGNGTWVIVEMTNLEGNVWNATIPSFPYDTNVTYTVIAEDKVNNTITTDELFGYQYQYQVIPEFPSFLILPLSMIATLLAVIIHRRKHTM